MVKNADTKAFIGGNKTWSGDGKSQDQNLDDG